MNTFTTGQRTVYRAEETDAMWKGDMCVVLECRDGLLTVWNRRTRKVVEGLAPDSMVAD